MAHVDYISDNGLTYNVLLNAAEATLAGGTIPSTSVLDKPGGMVLRYVLVQHPTTGRERKIKCPNPEDELWIGGTNSVTLPNMGSGTGTSYTVMGRVGERRYRRG